MPNVKIRIEKGVETAGDGRETQEQRGGVSTEKLAVASVFAHQMIDIGKQSLNYVVSNVGNLTGDYMMQANINNTLSIIGDLATVATGFATGNIVGGIVATIGVATKNVFQFVDQQRQIEKTNRQINYLRDRTGNANINESRGTEN